MAMTSLLAWIIFLLSTHAAFLFWIAVGLLILIGLMQTGFVALLAKRVIVIGKEEIKVEDVSKQTGHTDG